MKVSQDCQGLVGLCLLWENQSKQLAIIRAGPHVRSAAWGREGVAMMGAAHRRCIQARWATSTEIGEALCWRRKGFLLGGGKIKKDICSHRWTPWTMCCHHMWALSCCSNRRWCRDMSMREPLIAVVRLHYDVGIIPERMNVRLILAWLRIFWH